MFLEYLLVDLSLLRVETFSIDDVELTDVMEPDPLRASLSGDCRIKYWKAGAEDVVEECAFA